MKSKGEEAVRLAGRDAILSLTEELRASFEETLQRFVRDSLEDPTFLRQLILQIAGVAVPSDKDAELNVLLLGDISDGPSLRRQARRSMNLPVRWPGSRCAMG